MIKKLIYVMAFVMCFASCSASGSKADAAGADSIAAPQTLSPSAIMPTTDIPAGSKKVKVHTTAGDFTLLLYGDTPGHRDNFLHLVDTHAYDSVLFHRVINDFMVQAGDPSSKTAPAGQQLGSSQVGEQIPAEIVFPKHFHKRGALAAARTGDAMNPERKSSGSQFYIVTGRPYSPAQLEQMNARLVHSVGQQYFTQLAQQHEADIRRMQAENDTDGLRTLQTKLTDETNAWLDSQNIGMTPEMIETYSTIGGTPHLDNEYTVYGEVIDGMDVIDKIQKAATDGNDRPVEAIRILTMEVVND